MTRRLGRFGHGAKVFLTILILGYLFIATMVRPSRVDDGWLGYMELLALWTVLGGANVWIQISQRTWYDDQQICTKILGRKRICIRIHDISSIAVSHSWRRAVQQRPLDELQIKDGRGTILPISLRHVSLSDLQRMLDQIHVQTGIAAPQVYRAK